MRCVESFSLQILGNLRVPFSFGLSDRELQLAPDGSVYANNESGGKLAVR
jgi:hypothetical protein